MYSMNGIEFILILPTNPPSSLMHHVVSSEFTFEPSVHMLFAFSKWANRPRPLHARDHSAVISSQEYPYR